MEAMACGASPVVTNVGANAEIVGDGFRDRVVPVGDAATLARAIRAALMARGSDDASNHARCRVVQSYNLDLMVEQYANLYQSLNAER
jgi:glycosyltransferase involved in cell wall biosynthesis